MPAPVTIPVEIAGQPYRLVFKFGTVAFFEEATGQNLFSAFPFLSMMNPDQREAAGELANTIEWRLWGNLFWAVLQPEHRITMDGTHDLIDKAGLEQVVAWCMTGLTAYASGNPEIVTLLLDEFGKAKTPGEAKAAKKGK